MKKLAILAVVATAIFTQSPTANAQILAVDNFGSYTVGSPYYQDNIGTSGAYNGGTGWSGGWYTSGGAASAGYVSDFDNLSHDGLSLSYAGLASGASLSANYLRELTYQAGGIYNNDVNRAVGTGVSGDDLAGNTLWGDFTYKYTGSSATTAFSLGGYTFRLDSLPASSATQLLLYKVTYSATGVGTITYWLNPNATAFDSTATPTGTGVIGDITAVDLSIVNRTGDGNIVGGEIAFGATAADLVTVASSSVSVPEPSTYSMLAMGIGAAWLMYFRRRKSQV